MEVRPVVVRAVRLRFSMVACFVGRFCLRGEFAACGLPHRAFFARVVFIKGGVVGDAFYGFGARSLFNVLPCRVAVLAYWLAVLYSSRDCEFHCDLLPDKSLLLCVIRVAGAVGEVPTTVV